MSRPEDFGPWVPGAMSEVRRCFIDEDFISGEGYVLATDYDSLLSRCEDERASNNALMKLLADEKHRCEAAEREAGFAQSQYAALNSKHCEALTALLTQAARIEQLEALIARAVTVCQDHIHPEGTAAEIAMNEMIGIFDGPEYRAALASTDAGGGKVKLNEQATFWLDSWVNPKTNANETARANAKAIALHIAALQGRIEQIEAALRETIEYARQTMPKNRYDAARAALSGASGKGGSDE